MGKIAPALFCIFGIILATSLASSQLVTSKEAQLIVPDDFPTINAALQNATDGDTIYIKQGIYNETLVIDKQVTLRGEDTNKTILNGNCSGTVIWIRHDNVTVTSLTIQYSTVPNTPRTYWVHNLPEGWAANSGEWDAGGYPKDSGYFTRYGEWRLAGVHIQNATHCNITGNRIIDCGVGVWLYKSFNNTITGNEFLRNDYGLQLQASGRNNISKNTFLNGGGGIWFVAIRSYHSAVKIDYMTSNNTFSGNNFIGNQKPYENQFLVNNTQNFWDNGKEGNYWSDFNGVDSDHNGISDQPRQIIGEYYTGGWYEKGVWAENVCGVDNYPLMAPFDTASLFAVYTPSPEQESPKNSADFTSIEIVAALTGIIAIGGLLVYFKKRSP